jgi:hypothetical protein
MSLQKAGIGRLTFGSGVLMLGYTRVHEGCTKMSLQYHKCILSHVNKKDG